MMLEKPSITTRLNPEIKTSANQDEKTSKVCPISGCIISKRNIGKIKKRLKKYLKWIFKFFSLLKIKAIKIIVKGLTISIGWNLGRKKRSSHLLDPLTSVPKIGTKNKKNKEIKNKYIENLKRFFWLNEEKKIRINSPRQI